MVGGYAGRIVFIDLSTGTVTTSSPEETFLRTYLGGYGIGSRLLYDRMNANADPLGGENVLGLVTGPLTGTPALGGSRFTVVGKSPLTGTFGDANCGGYFGPTLKQAGFDAVFVTGIADEPVYVLLEDGEVELRNASFLWGKDSNETEDLLRAELGRDIEVVCIGQAGEKESLIAAIMHDKHRAAARSGLGAVMGAKQLKAVVARGTIDVPLADAERARALRRKYMKEIRQGLFDNWHEYGTCGGTAGSILVGDAPVRNWGGVASADFSVEKARRISDESIVAYQTKRYACHGCQIACGGVLAVPEGSSEELRTYKPEYETLASFGSNLLNDDVESIIRCNDICNRYGLDTISTGAVVAFAIECFQNGLLTTADTGGLELAWGRPEAIVALTEKIGEREDVGDALADGVNIAAAKIGGRADQFAIHVHGQEVAMHSPLYYPGLALVYQLDATPGRHSQGLLWDGLYGEAWDRSLGIKLPVERKYEYAGKGETYRRLVLMNHTANMAGVCQFHFIAYDPEHFPEFLEAVTGWPISIDECLEMGERAHQLRHVFNLREGLNPLKFELPDRTVGQPPFEEGPVKGVTVDVRDVAQEFLEAMAWDPETAWPSRERLVSLGLGEVADDLYGKE